MKGGRLTKVLTRGALIVLVLLLVVAVALGLRLNSFSRAVSGKGLLTSEIGERAQTSHRFNLLVMGYGGGKHDGTYLTDSMLLYSIPVDGGVARQIGIPRDLWVESPAGSGQFRKVNAAYANAIATSNNPRKAAAAASKSVSRALGVPVHGWMTVDFHGFRDLVDALGGVEVDVQRTFTARYPRNDDPSVDFRWKKIKFEKGRQEMDGDTAITYARARYSANPVEGTDFGRAARQQRLVHAIKAKLLSPAGWVRSFAVMGAVQDEIRTNVGAGDLARIFRRGVDEKRSVVLSTANVLENATSTDGQAILLPRGNDWANVRRFVRSSLDRRTSAGR